MCTSGVTVARYYDPSTAQFLTRDPAVALTRSAYGYVDDNPLSSIDPTGLCGHWYEVACQVGSAATAVGSGIATGAEWTYHHPAAAAGIALGAVSLATGVGEIAGAALVIGDLTIGADALGAISLATGVGGAALDANDCFNKNKQYACVGFSLSLPGLGIGAAGILGFDSEIAAIYGLISGAGGFTWDTLTALCGEPGESNK